ncbi:GNAT family N-acetyltransferase [Sphingomonas alba]|uniref:GNAT family N-acetyltransferase n=1 Tax=Sphingomonas alba TaxID=2908208 RepID=A0ABT0RP48_9SPHN|nr:GNAT family N-acetyltransferase [Sphingomonas alba]MCL6684350.1 GNAT family N-acetyltransferase [Sphingomonas alba]
MAEVAIETERLRLRDWRDSDEADFYAIMNTPAVMRHLGGVQDPEAWHAGFERIRGFTRDFGHTFWIVEDKATGEIQGFCGLKRVNAPGAGDLTGTPEIGWRLRESAWGKGIAKEAAIASLDLGFDSFGYERIIAMTIAANAQSKGLMHRLGMHRRADLDFVDGRFGPEVNPQIVFEIEAVDWPAARQAALRPRQAV